MHRGLAERSDGDEEAGVEATGPFPDRSDPTTHPHEIVDGGAEVVLVAQRAEVDRSVVNGVSMCESQRRVTIGDQRSGLVACEQRTRFLEALADRSDHVAVVALAVGFVDLSAREHVHPAGEGCARRAPKHEDLDSLSGVAQQHDRRSRLHRDRIEGHCGRR